jgi:hypothetical protein
VAVRDDELRWFTSSFSGGNGNGCVEVAFLPGAVAVRDTKDRALPPHRYLAESWSEFLTGVRAGEFDSPDLGRGPLAHRLPHSHTNRSQTAIDVRAPALGV